MVVSELILGFIPGTVSCGILEPSLFQLVLGIQFSNIQYLSPQQEQ